MKQITTDKKETILMAIFTVLPMTLFFPLSEYFTDNSVTRILFSGLFGAFGAGLGFGLYYLTKNKSMTVKIATLTVILTIGIVAIRTIHNIYD
jgi:uncharacterized membrane protein (UPF0136 family)